MSILGGCSVYTITSLQKSHTERVNGGMRSPSPGSPGHTYTHTCTIAQVTGMSTVPRVLVLFTKTHVHIHTQHKHTKVKVLEAAVRI